MDNIFCFICDHKFTDQEIINECKLNDDGPYDLEDLKPIAEHIKKNIAVVDRERLNQII